MRIRARLRISGCPMVARREFLPDSAYSGRCGALWRADQTGPEGGGNHLMIALAPSFRGMQRCPPSPSNSGPMPARQKIALMLAKAGYTHAQIASYMNIRHRQTVGRLLERARAREKSIREEVLRILGEGPEAGA